LIQTLTHSQYKLSWYKHLLTLSTNSLDTNTYSLTQYKLSWYKYLLAHSSCATDCTRTLIFLILEISWLTFSTFWCTHGWEWSYNKTIGTLYFWSHNFTPISVCSAVIKIFLKLTLNTHSLYSLPPWKYQPKISCCGSNNISLPEWYVIA
jgi:hypothetical protein